MAISLVVLAWLALAATPSGAQESPMRGRSLPGAVVKVVSGDTIHCFVNGEVERVRYIGVLSPEPGAGDQSGVQAHAAGEHGRRARRADDENLRGGVLGEQRGQVGHDMPVAVTDVVRDAGRRTGR